jgi:hypothetical protein
VGYARFKLISIMLGPDLRPCSQAALGPISQPAPVQMASRTTQQHDPWTEVRGLGFGREGHQVTELYAQHSGPSICVSNARSIQENPLGPSGSIGGDAICLSDDEVNPSVHPWIVDQEACTFRQADQPNTPVSPMWCHVPTKCGPAPDVFLQQFHSKNTAFQFWPV